MADPIIQEIMAEVERLKRQRAEALPTVEACLGVMSEATSRLMDLGWKSISYCPKDGSYFKAVLVGSTKPADVCYLGEWPQGGWFVAKAGDLWPCRPELFLPPGVGTPAKEQGNG